VKTQKKVRFTCPTDFNATNAEIRALSSLQKNMTAFGKMFSANAPV
jgi:hypothetical protein